MTVVCLVVGPQNDFVTLRGPDVWEMRQGGIARGLEIDI